MMSISENIEIHKLDYVVSGYNNIDFSTMKIKLNT